MIALAPLARWEAEPSKNVSLFRLATCVGYKHRVKASFASE